MLINVNKIRCYRIKNNLTIKELADKIGVTREHLNQIELDKYPLSENIDIKLSSFFGINVDELYGKIAV